LAFPENQRPKIYSVSELSEEIRGLFEERFDFVWLEGEISNFSTPASGHYYMVLKDEKAQIRAVMFRFQTRYLRFLPENGMKVIAQGKITVYAPRGEYQIVLDYIEPMGVGALALAFEQLKRKLAAEGLFAQEIKRPLPFLPQRVAVITSPTGAAIRDFLKIIRRRFANIEIVVVPVRVQGEGAAGEIIEALDTVNRELKVDAVVLTRGGGSLEDLWAFNQEDLAHAIRASKIPVVSAVGHEIDWTISDYAADFRAPTPSAAAELLVVEKESLLIRLEEFKSRLVTAIRIPIRHYNIELKRLTAGLKDPKRRLAEIWMRLDEISGRLFRGVDLMVGQARSRLNTEERALLLHSPAKMIPSLCQQASFRMQSLQGAMERRLRMAVITLSHLEKRIKDLSPVSILKRGYSITRKLPEKRVLKDVTGIERGHEVEILLGEGELACRVEKITPPEPADVSERLK